MEDYKCLEPPFHHLSRSLIFPTSPVPNGVTISWGRSWSYMANLENAQNRVLDYWSPSNISTVTFQHFIEIIRRTSHIFKFRDCWRPSGDSSYWLERSRLQGSIHRCHRKRCRQTKRKKYLRKREEEVKLPVVLERRRSGWMSRRTRSHHQRMLALENLDIHSGS